MGKLHKHSIYSIERPFKLAEAPGVVFTKGKCFCGMTVVAGALG